MRMRSTRTRVAAAIAAGAATIAMIPVSSAVGLQSPPVGRQSHARVVICLKPGTRAQRTLTVPQPAAAALLRHGAIPGPCPVRTR